MITLLQGHGRVAQLDHRAYHWPRGNASMFATGSRDGSISICHFARELGIVSMRAPTETRALCVHPSGERLALIADDSGKLVILALDGSLIYSTSGPKQHEATPQWVDRDYNDCWFDRDGSHLWCAAHVSEDEIAVEVREARNWTIVASGVLEDAFGGSQVSIHPTPNANCTAIWIAAGQDGQNLFWVEHTENDLRCTIEPNLRNASPPSFSPTGREFLTVSESGMLQRLSYPMVRVEAQIERAYGPDAQFDNHACYIDERHALASVYGRVVAIDTLEMRIVDEVAVEGLSTDILYFFAAGDLIGFVHRIDGGKGLDGWQDGIRYFAAKSISDRVRQA